MKTFIELFNNAVKRYPENIAVEYKNSKITYQDLALISDKISSYLSGLFLETKNKRVGILMDKSNDYVVTIFSAIKAGITYVPIYPEHPGSMIEHIIALSEIDVLIYDTKYKDLIPSGIAKCISSEELLSYEHESDSTTVSEKLPEQEIIYIVFTSGTTGLPKGILTKHSNVYNYIKWCVDFFDASKFEYFLSTSTISFDLFVLELFYPLSLGKTVKLIDSPLLLGIYLKRLSKKCMISTVPSIMEEVIKSEIDLDNVTDIVLTGERSSKYLLKNIHEKNSNCTIWNLYGPTETTVTCCVKKIESADDNNCVGLPIDHTQVLILDEDLKEAGYNEKGEIFIGGEGVAYGYLDEIESSKQFVTLAQLPEKVFYRTGDIGVKNEQGEIFLHGRADFQVKINGVRIELIEIEEKLNSHPAIRKAVVIKSDYNSYKNDLVAFIETEDNTLSQDEIQNYLKERLSITVIPKNYIFFDQFPISSNGKTDRKKLVSNYKIIAQKI